jgi:fibronectin-binding autotransporter adhesin
MKFNLKNVFLSVGIFVFAFAMFGLSTHKAEAAGCTATASGNWSADTGVWTGCVGGGTTHAVNEAVTINAGVVVNVDTASTATTVTFVDPASTGTGNGLTFTGTSDLTLSGAMALVASTGTQSTTVAVGTGSLHAASIAIAGGATAGNSIVSVTTGHVHTTGNITLTGSATTSQFTSTGASTITIGGNLVDTIGNVDLTGTVGVVQIILTAGTFDINSGTTTASGATTIATGKTLTIAAPATVHLAAITGTGTGAVVNNGILTASGATAIDTGGLLTNAGTATLAALATTTTGSVTNSGTLGVTTLDIGAGGTITNTGTLTASGATTIGTGSTMTITSGTATLAGLTLTTTGAVVNGGTLNVTTFATGAGGGTVANNGTLAASGAISGSGTITQGAAGVLNIGSTSATFTLNASTNPGNTVNYNAATDQTVKAVNYSNLTLSGGSNAVKEIASTIAIGRDLTIAASTIAKLDTGGASTANKLKLGSAYRATGTWGGADSAAAHKNATYFAGTETGTVLVAHGEGGSVGATVYTNPPVITCTLPQVLNTTTNTCVTPVITCTLPQVLNTTTNTCVTPVVTPEEGCSNGNLYNTSTGAVCVNNETLQIPGCGNRNTGFSTSSGDSCVGNHVTTITPTTYNFGTKTLKNGSRGEAVMELQRFLNAKLNLGLVVDGKLGPKTIAVIKQWQASYGLVADGLVGPKTMAKMYSIE